MSEPWGKKAVVEQLKKEMPDAELREIRGKTYLNGMTLDKVLDGVPISFTRRRYGTGGMNPVTYTWAEAFIAGQWVSLGDPWPVFMPPTKSLLAEIEIRRQLTAHQGEPQCAAS